VPRFAAEVDGKYASAFISEALKQGIVDGSVRMIHSDGSVIIPLLRIPEHIELHFELRDASKYPWHPRGNPAAIARSMLRLPDELHKLLPSRWEMIGTSLIIKMHPALEAHQEEVARAYAVATGATSVYRVSGRIRGAYRKPSLQLIYGTGGEVVHRENGVNYVLDAAQVMFSSANHDERIRMASIASQGEVIADLFAGIGHLSMPVAVHCNPSRIYAAEPDPVTYSYLCKTVEANSVQRIFTCVNDENAVLNLRNCDRVILGYLDDTRRWLPAALSMCREGGIIHLHEAVPRATVAEWKDSIERMISGHGKCIHLRKVKEYSALEAHMVMDILVTHPCS